jgi:hypothetical protein
MVKSNKYNFLAYNPRCRNIFVVLAGLVCLILLSGCTLFESVGRKTRNIAHGFKGLDRDMIKLVGMAPFDNRTDFSDQNLEANFIETLIETAEASCPDLHILYSASMGYPGFLDDLPKREDGRIDNLELAREGRKFGLNSIATIALTGIKGFDEKKGFWWFKDTHYFFRIQMRAVIYDTESGTKVLDEIISRNTEVQEFDVVLFQTQQRVDLFHIEGAFEYFADRIADKICDAMVVQPWKGYILSVSGERVILSSGKNSGLTPGQMLQAFDSSETIQGVDGHDFFKPGPKAGEIRITAVFDDSAEAVLTPGSEIQVGNVVKTKD